MTRPFSALLFALLLAGTAVVTGGCSNGEASGDNTSRAPQPSQVETIVLQPTSFTDIIEVTGSVEALDDATLSAQTSGTITMLADRGARIAEGEPVAQIDADEARAAVEQARAQFELAQDRFERQKPLYRDSIISALEFEQVRSERNQAKATLEQAEKRLANTRVDAPFTGSVEERFVEAGEQVSPGAQVARLVNTRRVRVTAGVPERYANDIQEGTPVQIDARRYGAGARTAEVTFAGNTIDPESRTFTIEATVPNDGGTLKPEMSVTLRVTRTTMEEAIVIPRTAVIRDETGTHAYVVEGSDTTAVARNRDLTLGPSTGDQIVVESGLSPDDEVITVGQNDVSPGGPVEVTEQRRQAPGDPGTDEALPTPPTE
jgi:membrane fusion protein (multidrug efflux system)